MIGGDEAISEARFRSWAREDAGLFLGMYCPGCRVDKSLQGQKLGQQRGHCVHQDKEAEIGSVRD